MISQSTECEILAMYADNVKLRDIAESLDISTCTIYNVLHRNDIEPSRKRGRRRIDLPMDEIIRRNEEGEALCHMAEEFGVCPHTLYSRFRERGVGVIRNIPRTKKSLPVERIEKRYQDGEHLRQIANDYPVSHETIRKRLLAAGVELRSRGVGDYQAQGGERDE